ncbi:hypothetical protein ACE01N_20450 [Saccharicrinis sp. FJH2]|uniref:hypothetical protein n=1 Tax=Saccharicrinis sp. FJH65 TaxID=3344659 RepID=UPI0035F34087
MIKLRFTNSIKITIDQFRPEIISDSLKSIGFKNIKVNDDTVLFKCDIKDQELESFQRKYGDGKLSFKQDVDLIKITIITDIKNGFRFSLLFTLTLVIITIYSGLTTDKNIENTFLFGGALLLSFILEYFIDSSMINYQQKKLLKLIDKEIRTASH